MKLYSIMLAALTVVMAGCSGPNTVARNVETVATINSLAGVPGAGLIGLAASAVDIFSKIGKPKIGKVSERVSGLIAQTPGIIGDASGQIKWGEYAIWRENGETKRLKIDQIPQEKLNYKVAWSRAVGQIPQGIFAQDNQEQQKLCLDAWEKGGLVVAEYTGLNDAKIVAVSSNNEPFELMLPEEWAEKSKSLK